MMVGASISVLLWWAHGSPVLQRFLRSAAILFLVHALAHNGHYTVARYSRRATIVPFHTFSTG